MGNGSVFDNISVQIQMNNNGKFILLWHTMIEMLSCSLLELHTLGNQLLIIT